jgi:hypothetical protein
MTSHTLYWLAGYWIASSALNSAPPISQNAPYWAKWLHGFAQALAGNLNKIKPPVA